VWGFQDIAGWPVEDTAGLTLAVAFWADDRKNFNRRCTQMDADQSRLDIPAPLRVKWRFRPRNVDLRPFAYICG
jgi:hypothetical protein